MKKLFLLLAGLFFLGGCNVFKTEQPITSYYEEIPIEHDYSEVEDFTLIWETMFDVNLDSYYVYFYSLNCNHCQELKNFIIEKALVRKDIYFAKSSKSDQISNTSKTSINAEKPEDIWILGYPSLIKIDSKKCSKNLAGNSSIINELN